MLSCGQSSHTLKKTRHKSTLHDRPVRSRNFGSWLESVIYPNWGRDSTNIWIKNACSIPDGRTQPVTMVESFWLPKFVKIDWAGSWGCFAFHWCEPYALDEMILSFHSSFEGGIRVQHINASVHKTLSPVDLASTWTHCLPATFSSNRDRILSSATTST